MSRKRIVNESDLLVAELLTQSRHIMLLKQKSFSGRSSLASMSRSRLILFALVMVNSRSVNVQLYVTEGTMRSFQIPHLC